jgi:mannitol-1-/sugar-/sorbitol-6-/2-deoxyglucose-6-phosphatase
LSEPSITSVIFDMDGLLIDSEPIWRVAEASVLAGLGVELTDADLLDSTGRELGEMVARWRDRIPRPGPSGQPSDAEIAHQITDLVVAYVKAEGQPMPGVCEAIELFERWGLRFAIASSSPRYLIDAVCERLGLAAIAVRCSAADEAKGKPAPDVYLAAARGLGVAPASCLAMEDSVAGIASAKAAGMRCIAVPDPLMAADPGYRQADLVLDSLTRLDERALRGLGVRPASAARPQARRAGPGWLR